MERRVTSPTWGPPPPRKQALSDATQELTIIASCVTQYIEGDISCNLFQSCHAMALFITEWSGHAKGKVCQGDLNKAIIKFLPFSPSSANTKYLSCS